ncbi:MAG: class I SAM-dependent methyltransferase [Gemmatimonadaceae bacterium]|nr:class I SAM-dependent methyltransferase [Gemmatimonadaceae bacterium]
MYTRDAEIYDTMYSFKDYPSEVRRLRELIAKYHAGADSILDVACGTGKHLALLRNDFSVEGVDLSAEMLSIARERCPGIPLHQSNMVDFELSRRFDVVMCLFGSICLVKTVKCFFDTVRTLSKHLNPGGILIIEPSSPGRFQNRAIGRAFRGP